VLLTETLDQHEYSIVAREAGLKKIETGYAFTEGPAVAKEGNVYFTDSPKIKFTRPTRTSRGSSSTMESAPSPSSI